MIIYLSKKNNQQYLKEKLKKLKDKCKLRYSILSCLCLLNLFIKINKN